MPHSSHLDQLHAAVQKELSDEQLRANRCDSFLEQIIQYQKGKGPLPDEQQFLLWREDLKKTMTVRALKAAMDLPAQDDRAYDGAPFSSSPEASSGRGRSNGSMDSSAP
jgi:hypothetical protein